MTDEGSPEDQQAVGEVLWALAGAFARLDTSGLQGVYASDADWTNAFGTTRTGSADIIAYLDRLFADPHFAAGKPVGPPQASMRFPAPDVAVVKTYLEREDQETSDGTVLPVRRNHSLKVLKREPDGWKIISDLYMDARDDETMAAS